MSCDQTASTSNAASTLSTSNENSQKYFNRHIVIAAEHLVKDSSTEVVDVSKLSQESTSIIQSVQIGIERGRLRCINDLTSTACWIKVVPFANDCHSYNMLLTITTTGVIMKTTRNIAFGETLFMWFDTNILTILNMLFLRPYNIQGYNRYVCHICKKWFEFPNPLKVHIALKCDQLDINHLWTELENEFNLTMRPCNTQSVAVPPNGSARALEIETIINNLERSSKGYPCFYCEKICKTKHNLKIHIRTHTGFKPFKCIYCSQTFGTRGNWTKHVQLHANPKSYVNQESLERHITSEHDCYQKSPS